MPSAPASAAPIAGTNADLQRLIDAAAPRGGAVELPAGTFLMHDALHLRTGVRVRGSSGVTVLRKAPSVASALRHYIGYGHYEFSVLEPEKFCPGMGVIIRDANARGFYETQATITARRGDLFFIDRPLVHDYVPGESGEAVSLFPLVAAHGVSDAAIADVVLDGNDAQETLPINGCRGGGVFMLRADRVELRGIEVRRFRGDAISFQQCTDVFVRHCRLHHNTGGGIHPGSGSVRYVIEDNHIHDNGANGVFYCLRTTHSICRGNRIENNGHCGISVGERDSDQLITGNTIAGNGRSAVHFRATVTEGGDRVHLQGNTLGPNGGEHEILIEPATHQIDIAGNTIRGAGEAAVSVAAGCRDVYFHGNTVDGRPQRAGDVRGEATLAAPVSFAPLGPETLPLDGAAHLGLAQLPAWGASPRA